MTAEIVNLRRTRKAKTRDDQAKQAAENRVRYGRSRSERVMIETTQAQAIRHLDGHRMIEARDVAPSSNERDDA